MRFVKMPWDRDGIDPSAGEITAHDPSAMAGKEAREALRTSWRDEIVAPAATPAFPRLLIVDDDIVVLNVLGRLLDAYDVLGLTSPREALSRLRRGEHFDLVLADVMMLELRGDELYAAVRREMPDVARRFTFMTGGATDSEAAAFLETMGRPVLAKPFRHAQLDMFLRQALSVAALEGEGQLAS